MNNEQEDTALPNVEHIVVVMFENRSFDNVLGWTYSFRPPHFIPDTPYARYNGLQGLDLSRYTNNAYMADGKTIAGFRPTRGFTTTAIGGVQYLLPPPVDPHEEFDHMSRQIYGPWERFRPPVVGADGNAPAGAKPTMDSFAMDYQDALGVGSATTEQIARVMETGTYSQTYPFGVLARAYAVSDAWYSSTPTQTNPNRAFMACGTSQGWVDNGSEGLNQFNVPTIWNRLTALKKTWKIYWENTFPPDETDGQPWTRRCFTKLSDFGDECFPHVSAFHRDARLGRLPFFSFIEPSWTLEKLDEGFQGNDLHPPGDIRPGLQFLSAIYTSLVSNQAAWARTLLLVTFDEHGGTFDHVPPPDNVTPDQSWPHGFRFDRVGPRVPTLLISPMVEPGTVFRSTKPPSNGRSYPYDHTSIPATILKLAGVKPEQYGLYDRVEVAPTFEGVLRRANNPRTDVQLGEPEGDWVYSAEPTADDLVRYGDAFLLRYDGTGPTKGWYVKTGASTEKGQSLWLVRQREEACPFRFTLGYSSDGFKFPFDTFVRTTGVVHIQHAASWAPDSRNEAYLRVPDTKREVARWAELGRDDQWWYSSWYISNVNRAMLGWGLTWGSVVTLEYHALNSNTHWLPRKLLPYLDWSTYYLAVGDDGDFGNPNVGRWIIERR